MRAEADGRCTLVASRSWDCGIYVALFVHVRITDTHREQFFHEHAAQIFLLFRRRHRRTVRVALRIYLYVTLKSF